MNHHPESFLPLPDLPLHILLALAEEEPLHGWGIIKRVDELTGGRKSPSSGSLYLALARLAERHLLEEVAGPPDNEDARRRYYRLTPFGRRVLEAESRRLAGLVAVARAAEVLADEAPR